MKKILLVTGLFLSLGISAQNFEWQWAKRGGGSVGDATEPVYSHHFNSEQVLDIVVDQDNNYYFLTQMTQGNTEFGGVPVTVYNPQQQNFSGPDIVIASTDCSGNLRWTQTIGGGGSDYAYKIELDNNGGLYIAANIVNISNLNTDYPPPHFSPADALPLLGDDTGQPNEGYKTSALLKYNTANGNLVWRVMPQGDTTFATKDSAIHQVQVSSDGTIHTLVTLQQGTHLGGQLTVPDTPDVYKHYIVKYSASGQVTGIIPLAFSGFYYPYHSDFRYDENLQRYYLAGFRTSGDINDYMPLSYGGVQFTGQAYMMAISNTGTEIWRKESNLPSGPSDSRIYALEIDAESNLYITGKYFVNGDYQPVSLGGYQLPVPIIGNICYVMKMNAAGQVQWLNIPAGYNEIPGFPTLWTGNYFAYALAINGNEIAVATDVSDQNWGTVAIDRPQNHMQDPGLLRLNKNTGQAIALHDIMSSPGVGHEDGMTAVAVDNDGNYITGGIFRRDLFTLPNDNIPTFTKVGGQPDFTDFFVAKLAASPCGTAGVSDYNFDNTKIYPNPAKDFVTLETGEELAGYEVVNVLGQVLLTGTFEPSQKTIAIEGLSAGTYILNVTTFSGKAISRKIIKE